MGTANDELHRAAHRLDAAAYNYRRTNNDRHARLLDDACTNWLRTRGFYIEPPGDYDDNPADLVSTYTGDQRLTADSIRLLYEFAVARARYHRCPTRNNLDASDAAADRLNSYDTHQRRNAAGDQVGDP